MTNRTAFIVNIVTVSITACAVDTPTNVGSMTSEIRYLTTPDYSRTTQCTVGGVSMHCCPDRMVMIGAHLGENVFKCVLIDLSFNVPFLDDGTQRSGMHACPQGAVMVGFRESSNQLACKAVSGLSAEIVDGGTQDGFPMHVCPADMVMTGIHADRNLFLCRS